MALVLLLLIQKFVKFCYLHVHVLLLSADIRVLLVNRLIDILQILGKLRVVTLLILPRFLGVVILLGSLVVGLLLLWLLVVIAADNLRSFGWWRSIVVSVSATIDSWDRCLLLCYLTFRIDNLLFDLLDR
jgi:hypothetical protein